MRRPHTASSGKRNRTRILKKGPGRKISRRARPESAALPAAESAAKGLGAAGPLAPSLARTEVAASRAKTSAATEAAGNAAAESGAGESTPKGELLSDVALRARAACAGDPVPRACYGFGAVRVGPLLGRLRLHLQTERFLAVHRNDALWQESCAAASLAVAAIAESMDGAELEAPLRLEPTPDFVLAREQSSRWGQGSFDNQDESFEAQGKWGTRKTGTAALAACGAELEMGECEIVASVITSPPQAKTSVFAAEKKADEGSAVATKQAHNRTADWPGAHRHERARGAR